MILIYYSKLWLPTDMRQQNGIITLARAGWNIIVLGIITTHYPVVVIPLLEQLRLILGLGCM